MHRRVAVLGAVGLCALAASCGGGPDYGALAGRTPKQILSGALSAAQRQRAVHYVLETTTSANSQSQKVSGDAGQSGGDQVVQTGSATVEVVLIGQMAYVQGNQAGLQQTLGFSQAASTKYANQWISVSPSDGLYQPITQSVTIKGIFSQLQPSGILAESTPGTISGQRVVGVKGGLPGTVQSGVTGQATLYVTTSSSTLPIGFVGQAKNSSTSITDIGAFNHWGEQLDLHAPTSSVPYSVVSKA
ncbi:MAG: hypothetical protein ACYDA2_02720 [Acidimicrobiales bacterium]